MARSLMQVLMRKKLCPKTVKSMLYLVLMWLITGGR